MLSPTLGTCFRPSPLPRSALLARSYFTKYLLNSLRIFRDAAWCIILSDLLAFEAARLPSGSTSVGAYPKAAVQYPMTFCCNKDNI